MTTLHRLVLVFALQAGATSLSAQLSIGSVSLSVTAGLLTDSGGVPVAENSLLQLIASWNGSFASPTATQFADPVNQRILWEGGFDSTTTGLAGAMSLFLSNLPIYESSAGPGFLSEGTGLTLRWYPSLLPGAAVPGGAAWGQYGFITGAADWIVPAVGGLASLEVITQSAGGSLDDSVGRATAPIALVPVPEASAFAPLAVLGLLTGVASRVSRPTRRSKVLS